MMKQSKNELAVSPSSGSNRPAYRVKIKIADAITTVKKSNRAERIAKTQLANKTKLPCNVGLATNSSAGRKGPKTWISKLCSIMNRPHTTRVSTIAAKSDDCHNQALRRRSTQIQVYKPEARLEPPS